MKVVIPVEQARVDSPISSIFGRSPFFYLFDSETNQGSFLESTFLFGQSAGIQAAQLMIDHCVDVLISNRCGENAMRLLSAGNITVYHAAASGSAENLELCLAGTLSLL